MSYVSALAGKKCLVVGAGVTGRAVEKALKKFGALPILFDEKVQTASDVVNQIPDLIDMAVISPGWRMDHPVIAKLKQAGVVIISEIDFAWKIKEVLAPKQRWVGLTGTNGKTTTIKMVESIFRSAKINGAACGNVGQTVIESVIRDQPYEYLAVELSSFQIQWSDLPKYESVAILNIAEDHIDWHGSFESYASAKLKLLNHGKRSIVNKSDKELFKRVSGNSVTWFSLDTPLAGELGVVENLLVDRAFSPSSTQAHEIAEIVDVTPTVPHNVLNALGATALAFHMGLSFNKITKALSSLEGVGRRFQLLFKEGTFELVDDYGHHPTEIASTLKIVKDTRKNSKKIVIFEPHRYTRTKDCWNQFLHCFNDADELYLLPIYPASEAPIDGIDTDRLIEDINKLHPGFAKKIPSIDELGATIASMKHENTIVVSLGAGAVGKASRKWAGVE